MGCTTGVAATAGVVKKAWKVLAAQLVQCVLVASVHVPQLGSQGEQRLFTASLKVPSGQN